MKALAREPERRYGSAQQLAEDVHPFPERIPGGGQASHPRLPDGQIRAPEHREGVAAAILVTLALAGGPGGVPLGRVPSPGRALAESEEVAAFLAGLFEASDPEGEPRQGYRGEELLEEGGRRDHELGDQPRVQARMLEVMARAYHGLGEERAARDFAERSLDQRRALLGEGHVDVAATLHTLGEILDELGDREASASATGSAADPPGQARP